MITYQTFEEETEKELIAICDAIKVRIGGETTYAVKDDNKFGLSQIRWTSMLRGKAIFINFKISWTELETMQNGPSFISARFEHMYNEMEKKTD